MRFRKSIKLFSGVRFNLSKSGFSTSLGVKGATVNVKSGRATRLTVGIPGSGLSETQRLGSGREPRAVPGLASIALVIFVAAFVVYLVVR